MSTHRLIPPSDPTPHDDAPPPRMVVWAVATLILLVAAHLAQHSGPGGLLAVSLYKGHLMSLAGWGGYWLDRALFPYGRPHMCLDWDPIEFDDEERAEERADLPPGELACLSVAASDYNAAQLRRALIVVGCLVCVGLGA